MPAIRIAQYFAGYADQEAAMPRKFRIQLALVLLGSAIVFNFIILVRGDESPG